MRGLPVGLVALFAIAAAADEAAGLFDAYTDNPAAGEWLKAVWDSEVAREAGVSRETVRRWANRVGNS